MDEFSYYNQLCVLEDIAAQYTEGKKCCTMIHANAELISSHLYRVAVIGEFKRGKSSLINALIGASVLPTDVIPLTAAITRLTYGTERKIIVHYKDGQSEEKTLDELIDYATKYDRQREITAESVREIEVKYPSVLCKNHIEILDTPGLNDNESMSEVTLSVLGEIDAAIVVISATKPLSLTEQNLIIDLIRQDGIRHLIFVVTFLDALLDEEEKDRMLSFICERLKKDLLGRAEKAAESDPILAEKARKILSAPDVFGVSSRQAMLGFTNDDKKLLKESRFPEFKEELLALLTAAQSEDIPQKVESVTNMVEADLPGWHEYEVQRLSEEEADARNQLQARKYYLDHSKEELTKAFREMDLNLEKKGLSASAGIESAGLERLLTKLFAKNLSSLTSQSITHETIYRALQSGKREAENELERLQSSLNRWIRIEEDNVLSKFSGMRRMVGLPEHDLDRKLDVVRQRPVPPFSWTKEPLPQVANLKGIDVMATVKPAINQSLLDYGKALNQAIAFWRMILLRQNTEDKSTLGKTEEFDAVLDAVNIRKSALDFNYLQHIKKIQEIKRTVASAHETGATGSGSSCAEIMICPNCGAQFPPGQVYCELCGARARKKSEDERL